MLCSGGGIVAAYAFLAKDAPRYIPGYSLCIAFTCLAILTSVLYYTAITWANTKHRTHGEAKRGLIA